MRDPIHPLHYSYAAILRRGGRIKPKNMERIKLPSQEMADGLTDIALSIFTDCANAGVPFQEALLAIYLSGLEHGHTITSKRQIC